MERRIDIQAASPGALQAMSCLQKHVNACGLEHRLLELVKMRASQMNGCVFCLDMHGNDALAAGDTAQQLFLLDAWREAPCYTERERAALEWTEAVTNVGETHVPDEVYSSVRRQFSEAELVDLTLAVIAINGWNRLNTAFRVQPGEYERLR